MLVSQSQYVETTNVYQCFRQASGNSVRVDWLWGYKHSFSLPSLLGLTMWLKYVFLCYSKDCFIKSLHTILNNTVLWVTAGSADATYLKFPHSWQTISGMFCLCLSTLLRHFCCFDIRHVDVDVFFLSSAVNTHYIVKFLNWADRQPQRLVAMPTGSYWVTCICKNKKKISTSYS